MRLEIGHSTPLKLLSIALFPGLGTTQKWILRRLMLSTFFVTFDWFNAIFEQSFVYFATLLKGQQYTDTANTMFHCFIIDIWNFGLTEFWKFICLSLHIFYHKLIILSNISNFPLSCILERVRRLLGFEWWGSHH